MKTLVSCLLVLAIHLSFTGLSMANAKPPKEPEPTWAEQKAAELLKKAFQILVADQVTKEMEDPLKQEKRKEFVRKLFLPISLIVLGYLASLTFFIMRMREYGKLVQISSWLCAVISFFGSLAFLLAVPEIAWAAEPVNLSDIVKDFFVPPQAGGIVILLIVLGIVEWGGQHILITLRLGHYNAMLKAATHFGGMLLVGVLIIRVFKMLADWANIKLPFG